MLNGIARCLAPSGLKKALSFRAVKLALQGQCERDGEVVRLASLERVQQRPHPERRFGEQHELLEVVVPEVEQLEEVPKTVSQSGPALVLPERITARIWGPRTQAKTRICSVQWSSTLSRLTKLPLRSGLLNGWVNRAELSKCPGSRARKVTR